MASPDRLYVKIRHRKSYKNATVHVCVGEVIQETSYYIKVRGVTYSFKESEPKISPEGVFWIPWQGIAVVEELPNTIEWKKLKFKVCGKDLVLVDEANNIIDRIE